MHVPQANALPTLSSKQYLALSQDAQRSYTMSQTLLAGLELISKQGLQP